MIVAASDIHLGTKASYDVKFLDWLDFVDKPDTDVVLLGDIFDFWARDNAEIAYENDGIVDKIFNMDYAKIHYVIGNHDYCMLSHQAKYPFPVTKSFSATVGGITYDFTHGYQFDVMVNYSTIGVERYERFANRMCASDDTIGNIATYVWDKLDDMSIRLHGINKDKEGIERFIDSKGRVLLTPYSADHVVVYGHTHLPYMGVTAINTGAWVNTCKTPCTYIEITDTNASLIQYTNATNLKTLAMYQ